VAGTKYTVDLGDEPNGVAFVLGALLEENFINFPERADFAARMKTTAVHSVDTGETVTQVWGPAAVKLKPGIVGNPKVTVKATVDQITEVSQLKMKAGGLLPVGLLFSKRGMKVLGQILTHKLVVKGLIKHPITALRFIAIVSIVPSR
jgi:hypothetical protein